MREIGVPKITQSNLAVSETKVEDGKCSRNLDHQNQGPRKTQPTAARNFMIIHEVAYEKIQNSANCLIGF